MTVFLAGRRLTCTVIAAHEQAASLCFVMKSNTLFSFCFLHQDPSILNKGEHCGLLYDWRFAKVTEVEGYEGF